MDASEIGIKIKFSEERTEAIFRFECLATHVDSSSSIFPRISRCVLNAHSQYSHYSYFVFYDFIHFLSSNHLSSRSPNEEQYGKRRRRRKRIICLFSPSRSLIAAQHQSGSQSTTLKAYVNSAEKRGRETKKWKRCLNIILGQMIHVGVRCS